MKKKHYIKSLLLTTALVTSGSMIAMPNANASEITPSIQLTDQISENVILRDLTIEEIYDAVAERRNISYEEAKKEVLDDARVKYYQNNPGARNLAPVSESVLESYAARANKQLEAYMDVVNESTGAQCFVRYGVLVEVNGSGSFAWISSVKKGTEFVLAYGTGTHTYSPGYVLAEYIDANRVQFNSTGNLEATVLKSHGPSYTLKGFTFAGSSGTNEIYRKSLTINKQLSLF